MKRNATWNPGGLPLCSRTHPGSLHVLIWLFIAVFLALGSGMGGGIGRAHDEPPQQIAMTPAERQWLDDHADRLILAPTPDFPPLEILDATGRFTGYAGEMFALIEKRLGVRFRSVNLGSWDAIVQAGRRREIALTSMAQHTAEREAFWSFTAPMLEAPTVIITSNRIPGELTLKDLAGLRVGVVQSFAVSEYLGQVAPELRLIAVEHERLGLRQVALGELDALITVLPPAVYHLQREGLSNLRVAGDIGYVYRYRIASRNDWPVLHQLLERALASISEEERRDIYSHWVKLEIRPTVEPQTAFSIAAMLLAVLMLIVLWNRSLQRQVRRRTLEIRRSEQQYRALFEAASDGILLFDEHRVTDCNRQALAMFRTTRDQLLGATIAQLGPEVQPDGSWSDERARELMRGVLTGASRRLGWRLRRRDGTDFDAEIGLDRFEAAGRFGVLALVRDVTERNRAELEVRLHEENLRAIFDTTPVAIAINRITDGVYVAANPAFTAMVGRPAETVLGASCLTLDGMVVRVPTVDLLERARTAGRIDNVPLTGHAPDGTARHFLVSACPMVFRGDSCVLSITADITDTRRLEEELRQVQKMDVVGQLAGGIAHDFNNMLTGILGYAELLGMQLPPGSPLRRHVGAIVESTRRAADLTRQLLVFSRKGSLRTTALDLHEPLRAAIQLLEHSLDRRISIETALLPGPAPVLGDAILLQNAFLNLGLNARDAMPDGGRLCFTTREVVLDAATCTDQFPGLEPGLYVEVAVSDSGVGIPPALHARIFDPFFTTKSPGKGTGLGLAMVFSTVKEHRGGIHLRSAPGQGSVFRVLLPRSSPNLTTDRDKNPKISASTTFLAAPAPADAADPVGAAVPAASPAPPPDGNPTGIRPDRRRILVIDDEEEVRRVLDTHLRRLGHEVVMAADGEAGLAVLARDPTRFDLVITDMIMPRLDGRQVLARASVVAPSVPIVVCSGFHPEGSAADSAQLGAVGFIQKPFDLAELTRVVTTVLQQPHLTQPTTVPPRADGSPP